MTSANQHNAGDQHAAGAVPAHGIAGAGNKNLKSKDCSHLKREDQALFTAVLRETLARGQAVAFRVRGPSMLPWLREGQKVMVAPLAGRQLRRGDIALFWRNEQEPVLHRVVQPPTADGVVACRGDAEWGPPELVPLAAVAGVVALPLWRRRLFLLIHPARRWVNRLILQWRQRHG